MADDLIKARIVFDTSAMNNLSKGAGATSSGSAEATGISGAVSKGFEKTTMMLGAIAVTSKALYDASPRLQASLSILTKSLMLVLRPIGDVLSFFVRPLAISLLKYAVPFYKGFQGSVAQDLEESGAGGILGGMIGGATIGGAKGGVAGAIGGGIAGGVAGLIINWDTVWESVGKGIANIKTIFNEWFIWGNSKIANFFQGIGDWIVESKDKVVNWFEGIVEYLSVKLPEAWETVETFFTETVPLWIIEGWEDVKTFFSETVPEWITETWEKVKTFFTITVPEWITKGWDALKTFVSETVPEWIIDGWDALKTFLTTTVPEWFGDMASAAWEKIKSYFSFGDDEDSTETVEDAIITPSGQVIKTNPADYLIATKNPHSLGGGSGSVTINISLNALDASSIDQNVLSKIANAINDKMRRGLSGRTTESIGI